MQAGPTIKNWTDVTENYKMQRVTFSVHLKMDFFLQHWEKWVQYVKPLRPDLLYPCEVSE